MVRTSNDLWKKILYLFIIMFILVILDNTLMPSIAIKGAYPSILLSFIICYSIINGSKEAVILGIIAGFVQDIYFSGILGINMLCNMLICVIAAKIGENIFKEKAIVPVLSTFLLSIIKTAMVFVLFILIKQSATLRQNLVDIALYKAIYEMVITIIIYKMVLKFSETKTIKKEWRF